MPTSLDDYRALREAAALLDLASWRVLRLVGSEVREFLQGTATQDLASLDAGRAAETLFLSEKGRPLALAWVAIEPSGTEAWIVADEGSGSALRPHFERFRIMEDVEFEGPDGMPGVIGVAGPRRDDLLASLAEGIPGSRALRAEPLSFLLTAGDAVTLPAFAAPEASAAWRIGVGLPAGGVDFDVDRIATELDRPQAISFTKGCYVGQEVVARTSNRGQVRRRRVGFRFVWPETLPARLTPLTSGGAAVGFLTSAAREPGSGDGLGMGYLSTESIDRGGGIDLTPADGGAPATPIRIRTWPL